MNTEQIFLKLCLTHQFNHAKILLNDISFNSDTNRRFLYCCIEQDNSEAVDFLLSQPYGKQFIKYVGTNSINLQSNFCFSLLYSKYLTEKDVYLHEEFYGKSIEMNNSFAFCLCAPFLDDKHKAEIQPYLATDIDDIILEKILCHYPIDKQSSVFLMKASKQQYDSVFRLAPYVPNVLEYVKQFYKHTDCFSDLVIVFENALQNKHLKTYLEDIENSNTKKRKI